MSKFSDNNTLTDISFGSKTGRKGSVAQESAMGSVVDVLTSSDTSLTSIGDIIVRIKTQQSRLLTETASPINPHCFTIPLPNEKVHCVKDGVTGEWYYTGIAGERGVLNHLLNADNIAVKPGTDAPYSRRYFISMPKLVRTLDVYEGDVLMQGRFGQSIRLAGSNSSLDLPWKSTTNSASPITIIRNGYLPVEDFETDSAGIWLISDQEVSIPLQATLPPDLQNSRDTFGSGQIVMYSDRIVIGSRRDSIILSTADTIALCTQNWQHDVDTVLDILTDLIEQVSKLSTEVQNQARASATQTFPVPILGSTLLSVQSPTFSTSLQNAINISTTVSTLKSNLEALKQK